MKEYQTLLQLIRASQFSDCKVSFDENTDWNAVYDEALSQAVIGIVSNAVPKEVSSADAKWQKAYLRQVANYYRYCNAEDELRLLGA